MTLFLKEVFQIAVDVHGNQRDRANEPYLGHICRVMSAMEDDFERAVAILHDTLEDCGSPKKANKLYVKIMLLCGRHVAEAVASLTRTHTEPYPEYIERLSKNPLAVKVKLADLLDNMRMDRISKLPEEDRARLLKKYQEAYQFLSVR